jgi:hypothetical protein
MCTASAAACDGVNLCEAPPSPDCTLYCDPIAECGREVVNCITDCDNRDYANPDEFLPQIACLNSTDRCSDRIACLEGDLARGELCLSYCAAAVRCNPQADQTMEQCVVRCATRGIGGQSGLVLEAASECLIEAGADAECAALDACINAADIDDACPAYCAELNRCGLAEDPAACEAECRGADSADFFADAACVLNGRRREANCQAAAECIGVELPPIDRACAELCAAQAECDDAIDPFLCGLACDPDEEGLAVRAGCASTATCDRLAECDGEIPEIPPACNATCGTIAGCPDLVGEGEDALFADFAHCQARCTGASMIFGENFTASLEGCVNDAMCGAEEIEACFTFEDGALCELGAQLVAVCIDPDFVGYRAQCEALDRAAREAQIACLQDIADRANAGDANACFEGILCFQ